MRHAIVSFLLLVMIGCASAPPPEPAWVHQGARTVDNGYIVYVAAATASNDERAQFKAQGLALADLANECSMIPKGTRVEDRFIKQEKYDHTAYVKIALEFQECDQARRTLDPNEIQRIANVNFTRELKRYQDLEETGQLPSHDEVASLVPPTEPPPPAPTRDSVGDDSTHLFVTRQYVAYQKEVVVLSPPLTYAPGTVANQQFTQSVAPASQQVANLETAHPGLRNSTWSQLPARPPSVNYRPSALTPRHFSAPEFHAPPGRPSAPRGPIPGRGRRRGRRR